MAAFGKNYETGTGSGAVAWTVTGEADGRTSTSRNPTNSMEVQKMKEAHKEALARAGIGTTELVNVVEPILVRIFFSRHLSDRSVSACDPLALKLHATVLMGMSFMMRFNELSALTTKHSARSESYVTFSTHTWKRAVFSKEFCELTPWPTAVKLVFRDVCFTPSVLS